MSGPQPGLCRAGGQAGAFYLCCMLGACSPPKSSGVSEDPGGTLVDENGWIPCDTPVIYDSGEDYAAFGSQDEMEGFCESYNTLAGEGVKLGGSDGTEALGCLCEVEGAMIFDSSTLTSIRGFSHLERVGGSLFMRDGVLTEVEGFDELESIGGYLTVYQEADLERITGFEKLREAEALDFEWLDSLESMPNFTSLQTVQYNIDLNQLASLRTAPTFPSLTSAMGVRFSSDDALERIEGFGSMEDGAVDVALCPSLVEIDGFDALKYAGEIDIYKDTSLKTVRGFGSLVYSDAGMTLSELPLLSTVDAFGALERIESQSLEISHNKALNDLSFLGALQVVGDGIYVARNKGLRSLSGLDSLEGVYEGPFQISHNPDLEDLGALPAFTYVGGTLELGYNDALADISGLSSLATVVDDLIIVHNPSLASADAEALHASIGDDNIGGTVEISTNGP